MATATNQISESIKEGLVNFKDGIIGFINQMIEGFVPDFKVEFVFVISVLIAIIITRWQNPERKVLYGTIVTLLVYSTLRFLGIPFN